MKTNYHTWGNNCRVMGLSDEEAQDILDFGCEDSGESYTSDQFDRFFDGFYRCPSIATEINVLK